MKKEYIKPMAQMEQFALDIQFASDISSEMYQTLYQSFENGGVQEHDFNGNGELDNEDWNTFLGYQGYDNSSSGFCYHGNVKPS